MWLPALGQPRVCACRHTGGTAGMPQGGPPSPETVEILEHCKTCHVLFGRAFLDLTRAALARAAVDAAAAEQAPAAGLGLGSGSADGAPQGPLAVAAAAVLTEHRPAAEAARRWPSGFAQLKQAGQAVAMLLVREADLEGMVAAGEEVVGKENPHLLGYPARPFDQHLADALARHAKQAAGVPV